MYRIVITLALLLPVAAVAQTQMLHQMNSQDIAAHHIMMSGNGSATLPTEPGQSEFAAIQEIVAILEADPKTDWSKVSIEALRQHLIDMDNVTLKSQVTTTDLAGGVRFSVTGADEIRASIRRMVFAHAMTMRVIVVGFASLC